MRARSLGPTTPRPRTVRAGLRRPQPPPTGGFLARHRAWRLMAWLAGMAVLLFVIGTGATAIVYASFQAGLPSVAGLLQMGPPRDSYLYSQDGILLAVLHEPGVHHIHVPLSQISPYVIDATVAVEDRHFYQGGSATIGGTDLPRLIEAGLHDLVHRHSLQGASTIPEQLAKISFLSDNQSLAYKVRELLLGAEISQRYTRNQVIQMYLNRIDYGNQAVGIGTAAELYFHIPSSRLDLAQASMLAGVPDAPTLFDPLNYVGVRGPNYAKERQQVVLEAMVANHYISQAAANRAYAQRLSYFPWEDSEPQRASDFVAYAVSQLQQQFGESYLNPGGWTIITSLDMHDQLMAQGVVQNPATRAQLATGYNIRDAALVSLDPRDGEVLAMVGTSNNNGPWGQINMTTTPRRPGSTFKLYTYTAAIASGEFTMTTPVLDAPIDINGYTPHNYDFLYHGLCPVQSCVGNSFNIPAVKVEMALGLPVVASMAERMGATSLLSPGNTYGPALTLGGLSQGLTELQLATGGSVLASGGVLHQPTAILRVSSGGATLYQYDPALNSAQVVAPAVAYIMNEMLSNNNNRIQEFGLYSHLTLTGRKVAAKTGTTDFQYANGAYSPNIEDNWTVGWTPQLLTAMWVGNPNGAPLSGVASGITGAAPLWQAYMQAALQGRPLLWYHKPADVVQVGYGSSAEYYLPSTVTSAYSDYPCPSAYQSDWNGVCPAAPG
ncbi:MAG TPA: transglycosylase domain-containing protein [Verrucomicrobiae bacterium]|nr:transglycosylase domain-containing protein [Verrucomicrobiae bacterium]